VSLRRFSPNAVFAIALAFAVAVFTWYVRSIHDFFVPGVVDVVVPTFVGQNESDALALGRREHLQMLVIARRTSDRFPKGVVTVQDPIPGTQVREERRVSLIVSEGVQYVSMPDLRDQSIREAGLILSNLHLHSGKAKIVENNDVDAGHIVSEDPPPLTSIRQGTTVNFEVSTGPPANITVPNLIGMQIDDARAFTVSEKIRLGQTVWTPFGHSGPPRGVVVRQKPHAGSNMDGRSMLSLQVSAGPHQFGFLTRETAVSVTVPLADNGVRVNVVAVDALGTHLVFDGYGAPGQRIDLVAVTCGTAHLETYLNNTLLDTTPIGREPAAMGEITAQPGTVTRVDPASLLNPTPTPPPGGAPLRPRKEPRPETKDATL
jgi:beta-lactam-binding protein with PASTA domain